MERLDNFGPPSIPLFGKLHRNRELLTRNEVERYHGKQAKVAQLPTQRPDRQGSPDDPPRTGDAHKYSVNRWTSGGPSVDVHRIFAMHREGGRDQKSGRVYLRLPQTREYPWSRTH